jgi:hypothetical protein
VDTAWVRGSHRDMATCAARSRIRVGRVLPQATAASSEHGQCPAAMATPAIRAGQQRSPRQTLPDTSAVTVRQAVQVPDTADGRPRPVSARRVRWLREPVAESAAAGGM